MTDWSILNKLFTLIFWCEGSADDLMVHHEALKEESYRPRLNLTHGTKGAPHLLTISFSQGKEDKITIELKCSHQFVMASFAVRGTPYCLQPIARFSPSSRCFTAS